MHQAENVAMAPITVVAIGAAMIVNMYVCCIHECEFLITHCTHNSSFPCILATGFVLEAIFKSDHFALRGFAGTAH